MNDGACENRHGWKPWLGALDSLGCTLEQHAAVPLLLLPALHPAALLVPGMGLEMQHRRSSQAGCSPCSSEPADCHATHGGGLSAAHRNCALIDVRVSQQR